MPRRSRPSSAGSATGRSCASTSSARSSPKNSRRHRSCAATPNQVAPVTDVEPPTASSSSEETHHEEAQHSLSVQLLRSDRLWWWQEVSAPESVARACRRRRRSSSPTPARRRARPSPSARSRRTRRRTTRPRCDLHPDRQERRLERIVVPRPRIGSRPSCASTPNSSRRSSWSGCRYHRCNLLRGRREGLPGRASAMQAEPWRCRCRTSARSTIAPARSTARSSTGTARSRRTAS